jgi:hypothetical protein
MARIDREKLSQWLATDDHLFQCIGYSEGQECCLDKTAILDILDKMITEVPAVVVHAQPATATGSVSTPDDED